MTAAPHTMLLHHARSAAKLNTARLKSLAQELAALKPRDMVQDAPAYFAAAANVIAQDMKIYPEFGVNYNPADPDHLEERRILLIETVKEGHTRVESCDPHMRHIAGLILNTQHILLELAARRDIKTIVHLTQQHPDLMLPALFKIKRLFKKNSIPPGALQILTFALQPPERPRRAQGCARKHHDPNHNAKLH
jgi:UDP-N-acetyl-D-mannosaminuronate dehydrogenase